MKSNEAKLSLAIMAIFFIMPGALIVNPALQSIADAYPHIPYTTVLLISTIPLLMVVPTSLLAGAIAGTKVKYKTLITVAMLLYVIGGSMPFFIRDFFIVLVARTIYGIGVGLATPLANGLVIRLFDGQKRANMMGLGSVIINVASTIFMILSGFVSVINFNLMWLIHLIALIPMVLMMLFLSEPEKTEQQSSEKSKLPDIVFILSLAICFIYMNVNAMILNMSTIITTEKIGNAALAGTILSMYTVGGIIGGFIFGKMYKMAGKMTIPLSIMILSLGLGISNFSHSVIMITIGCTIAGVGFFVIFPAILMEAGQKVSVSASAMVSAMILGSINLGGFLSSFYIGLLAMVFGRTSPRLPILAATVITFLISVSWGIVMKSKKAKTNFSAEK